MKLPSHQCGLYLTHNSHKDSYLTVEQYLLEDFYEWKDEESKKRAIASNEMWTLQWYPNTPVGFLTAAAPTLEELLEFSNEEDRKP